MKKQIALGIAVDREQGLIVPVLRDPDKKSIAAIARELATLIDLARTNKLTIDQISGATFTLNNTGAFGAVVSAPIINQPQAAILATEAIIKQPAVVDDRIEIRSIMHLSISFDHRMLDGGQVGRFLQTVRRTLEAFGPDSPIY